VNWLVNTVVVASDGSAGSESVLASARAVARATRARVVVVHVNEVIRGRSATHQMYPTEDEMLAAAHAEVDSLKNAGIRASLELRTTTAEPARAIAETASAVDADLIVTGRSRHHTLWPLLAGSTSQRLIRFAACPVLVIPK